MPRHTDIATSVQQQIARLSGSQLSPHMLSAHIMEAILEAVPADGFRLFGLDPSTRLVNRLLAASDNDAWARLEWLRDVYLGTGSFGYIEHHELTAMRLPVVAVQEHPEMCWGYPRKVLQRLGTNDHYQLFHEHGCPAGGTIVANFSAHDRWIAALQLYRREPQNSFSKADVSLIRSVVAQVGQAISSSLALNQNDGPGDDDHDASGVVIIAPDNRVTMCTPAGATWLDRLRDTDATEDTPLPTAVWSAVASLRRSPGNMAPEVTVQTKAGRVRIEASVADADGSTAVVLAPVKHMAAPEAPMAWNLTTQERRVVNLLVQGQGNRQIAASLCISESTIEWHLRQIYRKLDVESRSQLIARFFRETYWPALVHRAETGPAR